MIGNRPNAARAAAAARAQAYNSAVYPAHPANYAEIWASARTMPTGVEQFKLLAQLYNGNPAVSVMKGRPVANALAAATAPANAMLSEYLGYAKDQALRMAQPYLDAVAEYNAGMPLTAPWFGLLFAQMNEYQKQGLAAPGRLTPETGRAILTQWAFDAQPGGFERVSKVMDTVGKGLVIAGVIAGGVAIAGAMAAGGTAAAGTAGAGAAGAGTAAGAGAAGAGAAVGTGAAVDAAALGAAGAGAGGAGAAAAAGTAAAGAGAGAGGLSGLLGGSGSLSAILSSPIAKLAMQKELPKLLGSSPKPQAPQPQTYVQPEQPQPAPGGAAVGMGALALLLLLI